MQNLCCEKIKNHFHINDLISLALKTRLKETRKWPNIAHHPWSQKSLVTRREAECRGTQREYSSKPLKHSIVERLLVFKR